MSRDSIPLLDISRLNKDQDDFVADLGQVYEEWGFAGIVGHGIDTNIVHSALRYAEAFFSLPEADKCRYIAESNDRGYVAFGIEKAKGAQYSDLKEFYHLGRVVQGYDHLKENIWPEQVHGFQQAFELIFEAMDKLAFQVLKAMALYLQLPSDYFSERIRQGEALLRVLHYPPILDSDTPKVRAAEHEDINLITLLTGSEQEGLEVLSRRGDWVPISMIEGVIICNVGDMMQLITNGKLPSTTHRVVNPSGHKAHTSRYSIPFFIHPNPDVMLECLPQCVDIDHPKMYSAMTSEEFRQKRLREIGLVK